MLSFKDFPDPPTLSDIFPKNSKETLNFLLQEEKKEYFKKLNDKVIECYFNQSTPCYPPFHKIFNALKYTPLEKVKVVILAQDPYHGLNQANGLAFCVNKGIKLPPSLKNIMTELKNDLNITHSDGSVLKHWAKQGVLLLNATLTVEESKPNSHKNFEWSKLTDNIVKYIDSNSSNIVWLLWGAFAQKKCSFIDTTKHLILKAAHPSPYSVSEFYECKHFSKCNEYLKKNNLKEIEW